MTGRPRARASLVALASVACVALAASSASAAGDPYLDWRTIETPHFRVHHPRGLEPIAEKVARVAEGVHRRLAPVLGTTPTEVTEVVLTDDSDSANGSATAIPYDLVRLYVTAPDDLSPLGDYDDWILSLVTHEYTHILHTDAIGGVPAIVNRLFGKTLVPNQAQPRWVLEGLAVLEETAHTGGGRLRSSIFEMYLRADVLAGNLAGLDQMSHQPRRWPQGNLWYLYGSSFLSFIVDTYGEETMRQVVRDYGARLAPFAINRSVRRATGRTYEELYEGWTTTLGERFARQVQAVEARGVREGSRLTHGGQLAAHPRWVPRAGSEPESLLYFRDDAHGRPGIYRLPLDDRAHASARGATLVARSVGDATPTRDGAGGLVFDSVAVTRRVYPFHDLFRVPERTGAPSGFEPERGRLTTGARAQSPDVSPDGRRIVWIENRRGTTTLVIASLDADGAVRGAHALVPSARYDQAFTPRFSPDGARVVYSTWTAGGYRDIRLVDLATGQVTELTHDRAMDVEPSFSPDGRTVYFSSDRAGHVPNLFAYDLDLRHLWQVTNVRTGAFEPEPSPDGATLAYVGYGAAGFDLYALPVDRATWLEPPPYDDPRPDPPSTRDVPLERHAYTALPSLRPRAWALAYGPGSFGDALSVTTTASDAIGRHSLSANMLVETDAGGLQGSVGYTYGRLPFDLRMSAFRAVAPRTGFRYGGFEPQLLEENVGVSSTLAYSVPRELDATGFALGYTVSRMRADLPLSTRADPFAPVTVVPSYGYLGSLHLGWSYANTERSLHGVGSERGFWLAASTDVADRALASDYRLAVFSYAAGAYLPMPWLRHHTLAAHVSSAVSTGDYPRQGLFYTGGFIDAVKIDVDTIRDANRIYQSAFVLRGYPPVAFIGAQYHLANVEYRFPIAEIDRGPSTLPVFVNRITGAAFADYGGAFDTLDTHGDWRGQLHLGVGGEIWLESTVGYFVTTILRLGYATGLGDAAAYPGGKAYAVFAVPF